ncbi:hypothetical protein WJX77_006383 [Trebouxia sp. C0004]
MSPDQQMLDLLLRHGASPYNPDKDGMLQMLVRPTGAKQWFKAKPVWKDRWCALIPRCNPQGVVVASELPVFAKDKSRLKAIPNVTEAQPSQQGVPAADGTVPGSTVGLELAKTQSSKPDGFVAAGCLLSGWTIFVGLLSTAGNKDWRQCDALAHFIAPSHLHLQPQAQVSTQA